MVKFLSLFLLIALSFSQSIRAQACDPPEVGNTASNLTVTVGASVSLKVSATGTALTYQWQVSSNGGTSFTDLSDGGTYSGTTTAVLNIANAVSTLHQYKFRCIVSSKQLCSTTSGSTTLVVNSVPLCSSTPTEFCCEYVNTVVLNGITFSGNTGFTGPGYYDYTGTVIPTVTAGTSIPVSVKVVTNSPYQEFVKIWIDFNRDGIPGNDPTELVFNQNTTVSGTHTFSGNIAVPTNAFNGNLYARLIMQYNGSPIVCGNYDYGNTFDFKIPVTGGVNPNILTMGVQHEQGAAGTVSSNPLGINTQSNGYQSFFSANQVVTLTAAPAANSVFDGWYGDVVSTANPLAVTMNGSKNIVAKFKLLPPPDVLLSNTVIYGNQQSSLVGNFSSVAGDTKTYTYSLVSGTGSTDNALFSINGSQLLVNNLQSLTKTDYSIRVRSTSNTATTMEKVFAIKYYGVPGTPTVESVISGSGEATVVFNEPSDSGGSPVTNYYVENASGSVVASGTSSPITVTGLTNGTSYTFKVKAENSAGIGGLSNASPAIVPGVVKSNVSCNGGSNGYAMVVTAGTVNGYTFSWSPKSGSGQVLTGLTSGIYTCEISKGNQVLTIREFTITQPAPFTATAASQTNVSCNSGSNGSATVSATGGTGSYSYSWSPSGGTAAKATGLSAGTYTVTVTDANACTTTQSFTITQPAAFIATAAAQTNVSCNGGSNGSATVSATGGTGSYSYSWFPSGGTAAKATGLSAGTYTVTVTDANACTTTQSFTITEPTALIATAASQTNVSCNGGSNGSATVSATGGTGSYSYSWSPSGGTAAKATGLSAGTYTVTVTDANACTTTQSFTITQPTALIATAESQTNVSCNGGSNGSATVSATGGTGSYSYSWSPSGGTAAKATGLSAGTYTVTVTDANACTTTQSFTITQPAAFIATAAAQTNVSCNGGSNGSATVSATGGTGSYSYSWFPSGGTAAKATGLSAGTYTVTVTDANMCTTTQSFTITQPTALIATAASQTNVSCHNGTNGSATVSATGGTGTYSYSWSPSGGTAAKATGLSAGTYTVTVTDANACTTTQSFTITQPTALIATAESQTNVSCNGGSNGSATVSATGGTGSYSYSWFPSGGTAAKATGLSAGTYTVTVTDANMCIATQSFTITQPATFIATAASQTNVSCHNGSNGSATVSATGGTGSYSYSWFPSGGTAATATGLSAGTYTVTVTDANACMTTQSFTITEPAAFIATAESQTNVSCHNGSNGSATVSATGGTGTYTYSWSPRGGTAAKATGLSAGTYTVTVTDANMCTTTQSFTITEPAAFIATAASQTNVSCNGGSNGSATVSATGGTGSYSYSWFPSGGTAAKATGLSAGTYTVTVTDANACTTTQSFTIKQPAAFIATAAAQTNVNCNGGSNGSATVSATGGTGSYSYSWFPSGGTAAKATGLSAGTYTVTVTDANMCITTQSFTITQPTAFIATAASQTNVSCNGGSNGSATVSATGGTGSYSYSWFPSGGTAAKATGLSAGTYTVTVTDANMCTTTQSFTITEPTALTATAASQTNVSCHNGTNGSATVSATGGTGTYTYSWSPSGGTAATATGLSAGTYTVTVTDANACTTTQSFTITEPTALIATAASQTNVSCNSGSNGSATVSATGGTGSYSYSWSPSGGTAATATGLSAGTYTVTVTDTNMCTTVQSFTITQPTALIATAASQTNVSCNGGSNGSATVSATGGTGSYSYSWFPSGGTAAKATGLSAGTYTVTVTDANMCIATQSFTITQLTALIATAASQTNVSCNGGSNGSATVSATGGTGSYSYSWSPSGGTAATATGLSAGTYTVTVTDANACITTQSFTITEPAVLSALANQDFAATCPKSTDAGATVVASGGTAPYTYNWDNGAVTASVENLSVGNHTVTITDFNGCTATTTVVTTFHDTVNPVPSLAQLPNVVVQCAVTPSDIVIPTATDNCSGTLTATTTDALSYTKQGTYTITWTYDDSNGNITTQQQTVVVKDVTAPVPTVANLATITRECAVTPSDIVIPTATDNCSGTLTATTTDALSYTKQGTYIITWKYDDSNGNITTQQQTVVVKDVTAPVPTVANLATITRECAVTPSDIAVPTATDNCSGTLTATTTDALSYTKQGTYTITWKYDDSNGNSTTQQQTVIVKDVTAPVPTVANLATITRECAVTPSDIAVPTATDNCSGTLTATTTDALSYTKQGTYTITWTYDDSNGNITTQQQTVVVKDVTAPVPTVANLATITRECAVTPSDIAVPTATDNCSGTLTATTTDALSYTKQGTYTITWKYDDANGNITTQQQTVIVKDVTAPVPVITNLATITRECAVTPSDILVPTATDNCSLTLTATTTDALSYTKQGTYTITWKYDDANGNITTQQQTVVVKDVTAPVPVITNLATITRECAVTPSDIAVPTATDNCSGTLTGTTTDALSYTKQGTYTITWKYDDANGNITTQQQTVIIKDVTAPVPVITNLATITRECAVTPSDILVPTATDNCSGTLTATTTDALSYTKQGTYTITWTYDDVNGNITTQQQKVVVKDVTAPVPVITNLATITRECAVTPSDIVIPTATDNCSGTLTATTTDALSYTKQGTYTITWAYDDSNGNITTQQQTVIVEASPLAEIEFSDVVTVYNGAVQKAEVANVPSGATVSYSITPDTGEGNGALNAGTYTVTAVVTPPATAVNCESVTLVAQLLIEKAAQNIDFKEPELVLLETAKDFQLTAKSDSGLPVSYTYSYTQDTPAATVTAQGWVAIKHSGSVTITAHQQGNQNYLPAPSVERMLVIESRDAAVHEVIINGKVYSEPGSVIYYMQDCNGTEDQIPVKVEAEHGANVTPARDFVINTPKPGVYRKTVAVVSQNGEFSRTYEIVVERPFAFEDIVIQKFDNTLLVNNNPQTNGGYRFIKYQWYRNGSLIGEEQVYSAGNSQQDILDENALYSVVVTTEEGDVIHSCAASIARKHEFKIQVYPNPVQVNEQLQVVFDYPSASFKGAKAELYTTTGKRLQSVFLEQTASAVQLPAGISAGVYMLVLHIEGRQEIVKVIVKQ